MRSLDFLYVRWRRLAATFFLFALFFGNQGFRSLVGNWLELRRLRGEIVALESEQAKLESRLASMKTGQAPLERIVRKELGFVRPGEVEYRFPPPSQKKD